MKLTSFEIFEHCGLETTNTADLIRIFCNAQVVNVSKSQSIHMTVAVFGEEVTQNCFSQLLY